MATPNPLNGVRLKIDRASQQAAELEADFRAFLQAEPSAYEPFLHFDSKTRVLTFGVRVKREPPGVWGVRLGELLHNLRSALDHLVWEMVILSTGTSPRVRKTQFAIFETEAGFRSRGIPVFLHGVSPRGIEIIASEQPFKKEGYGNPLWHLHELSNFDKHRTLHFTGTALNEFQLQLPPARRDVWIREIERRKSAPIQEDAILWRGLVDGADGWPFGPIDAPGHLGLDIAFDTSTPAVGGWLVAATVLRILERTAHVVSRIAREEFEIDF